MKNTILIFVLTALAEAAAADTYVQGHYRSSPDQYRYRRRAGGGGSFAQGSNDDGTL